MLISKFASLASGKRRVTNGITGIIANLLKMIVIYEDSNDGEQK